MTGIKAMGIEERGGLRISDSKIGQEYAVVETDLITTLEEGVDMRREELLDLEVLVETKEDLSIRLEERADLRSLFLDREKVSHITIKKRAIMGTE